MWNVFFVVSRKSPYNHQVYRGNTLYCEGKPHTLSRSVSILTVCVSIIIIIRIYCFRHVLSLCNQWEPACNPDYIGCAIQEITLNLKPQKLPKKSRTSGRCFVPLWVVHISDTLKMTTLFQGVGLKLFSRWAQHNFITRQLLLFWGSRSHSRLLPLSLSISWVNQYVSDHIRVSSA